MIKINDLKENFNGMSIEINKKNELQQLEQAANLNTYTTEPSRHFNSFCYDDDDYEESTIPLNEIVSQIPPSIAIKPESDEFIKSSVEDFVPIPSGSKDTSGSDSECDLPSCDDFSPINIFERKSVTFSNPLFDLNDDFTYSDDESLSDEDDIESKDSYVSNLDEPALLVTPLFDANENECFDPGGDKINAFDIPLDFKDGYYDSKGDVLYLESFLNDDTTPYLPPKVFPDRDPRSLTDINDIKIMIKVFDLGILEKIFSPTYESLPFKDRHYLFFTYVIQIFLPYFTYPIDSLFLLSSESEDTIFDPGISSFYFSSLEPVASHQSGTFISFNVYQNILNESPMKIFSSTCVNLLEHAEVYYECMEPFKSLLCLWVRSRSIDAIWLENVVTPWIEPAIKGFVTAPAVLKPKRLKVDKARTLELFLDFTVCEGLSTLEDCVLVRFID
nr:hypothetical protein [Tanacetum cinerariifolium]